MKKPEYITIKVRTEDHIKLKTVASSEGKSMVDKFSEIMKSQEIKKNE